MAKKTTQKRKHAGGRPRGSWLPEFGENPPAKLKAWREGAGISRAKLGKTMKVSPTSVQNWDTGRLVPQPDTQRALLKLMAETEAQQRAKPPAAEVQSTMSRLAGLVGHGSNGNGNGNGVCAAVSQIVVASLATGQVAVKSGDDVVSLVKQVRSALTG